MVLLLPRFLLNSTSKAIHTLLLYSFSIICLTVLDVRSYYNGYGTQPVSLVGIGLSAGSFRYHLSCISEQLHETTRTNNWNDKCFFSILKFLYGRNLICPGYFWSVGISYASRIIKSHYIFSICSGIEIECTKNEHLV